MRDGATRFAGACSAASAARSRSSTASRCSSPTTPRAPRCTRWRRAARDEALRVAARSRRRGRRAPATRCSGRHRHLSRGARDHQPRRRGHLLRLPVLRSRRSCSPRRCVRAIGAGGARRASDRSLRRLRPPDARAAESRAAGRSSSPTSSSGSCGWRNASRRRAARPSAATPITRCPSRPAAFSTGRALGRLPVHLAQAAAGRRDDAAGGRPAAPS